MPTFKLKQESILMEKTTQYEKRFLGNWEICLLIWIQNELWNSGENIMILLVHVCYSGCVWIFENGTDKRILVFPHISFSFRQLPMKSYLYYVYLAPLSVEYCPNTHTCIFKLLWELFVTVKVYVVSPVPTEQVNSKISQNMDVDDTGGYSPPPKIPSVSSHVNRMFVTMLS